MAENRCCSRTGCNRPAAASLSFRYETRQVWVTTLQARSGTRYDLCAEHADTLTVPRGWHRKEERPRSTRRTPQPIADTPAAAPATEGVRAAEQGASAALELDVPAALELDVPAALEPDTPAVAERGAPRSAPHVGVDRYARLLSELPHLAAQTPPPRSQPGAQLAIPVSDRPAPDAVVVSMAELAGARRRAAREPQRR